MTCPEVSIILPTYNRSHLIRRAISSVLNQTYRDFELIIVDDGSTDQTDKVVRGFEDERISYIWHAENLGAAAARNAGIGVAKGTYIAFQDSDDEWLPRKLEMQVKVLENAPQDVGAAYTDMLRVYKDGTVDYWIAPEISNRTIIDDKTRDFRGVNLVPQQTLIRKRCFDLAGVFDVGFRNLVDLDIFIRITKYFYFLHIKEPGVIYYSTDGISTNARDYALSRIRLLEKYSEEICSTNTFPTAVYESIRNTIERLDLQRLSATDKSLALEREIDEMRQNALWRAIVGLNRGFVEPLLPQSTQRRRLYDQGLSKIRSLGKNSSIHQEVQANAVIGDSGSGIGASFENFQTKINSGLAVICAHQAFSQQWYAIENWNGTPARWIASSATLIVYSDRNLCTRLSLQLQSFNCQRRLTIRLTGEEDRDNTMAIPTDPISITMMLSLKSGFNSVEFRVLDGCQRPCDIPELRNPDNRCLGIAFRKITIRDINLVNDAV